METLKRNKRMRPEIRVFAVGENETPSKEMDYLLKRKAPFFCSKVHHVHFKNYSSLFENEKFDVLFADLSPSDENLELIANIRSKLAYLPIIVITTDEDHEFAKNVFNRGAQDYLVKSRIDGISITRSVMYAIHKMELANAQCESLRKANVEKIAKIKEQCLNSLSRDLRVPVIGANRVLNYLITKRSSTLDPEITKILSELKDNNEDLIEKIDAMISFCESADVN